MSASAYRFHKPGSWQYMPLFEKIRYYQSILDERFAPFVDKLEVKRRVTEMCPDLLTAKVVKVLKDPGDLTASDLQDGHLLKATHGCGWNIVLKPALNVDQLRRTLSEWNKPYSGIEKQYTFLKPQFFIETIVDDLYLGTTGQARVFMVRCIHGKPVSVGVRVGNGSTVQNSYTIDFALVEPANFVLEKPAQWDEMIGYAKTLSAPFEFVRVDFYLATDGVYFSEFTFTPAGGHRVFSMKVEKELGKLWT